MIDVGHACQFVPLFSALVVVAMVHYVEYQIPALDKSEPKYYGFYSKDHASRNGTAVYYKISGNKNDPCESVISFPVTFVTQDETGLAYLWKDKQRVGPVKELWKEKTFMIIKRCHGPPGLSPNLVALLGK
jgi:hypothetical protein